MSGLIDDVVSWPQLPYVSMAHQVALGLQEMHKYGIVHCDIKKNNVLYEIVDGQIRTKITDFGVAQVMIDAEKVERRINVNVKAMSAPYASP